jgi:hypothetical protein
MGLRPRRLQLERPCRGPTVVRPWWLGKTRRLRMTPPDLSNPATLGVIIVAGLGSLGASLKVFWSFITTMITRQAEENKQARSDFITENKQSRTDFLEGIKAIEASCATERAKLLNIITEREVMK